MLKLASLKLNDHDEFVEFQELLEWMNISDQESLANYLRTFTSEQRNSLIGLRQVRKILTFDEKVIPRQYLQIRRQLSADK